MSIGSRPNSRNRGQKSLPLNINKPSPPYTHFAKRETANICLIKAEGDAGGGDVEGDRMPLDEGVVPRLVVAGGEVVADGYVQVVAVEHLVEHVVHVGKAVLRLVVGEAPHHDALDTVQHALEAQLREHAGHAWHGLAHVLKEEDDVALGDVVAVEEVPLRRAREVDAEHGHVAAQQYAAGLAALVVGVRRHLIGGKLAAQHVAQIALQLGVGIVVGQVATHVGMDAHVAGTHLRTVHRGDVAVADNPLGVPGQRVGVQQGEHHRRAIAAAGADDGLDIGVAQGLHQVVEALLRCAGIAVAVVEHMLAHDGCVAPLLECGLRGLDVGPLGC